MATDGLYLKCICIDTSVVYKQGDLDYAGKNGNNQAYVNTRLIVDATAEVHSDPAEDTLFAYIWSQAEAFVHGISC